MEWFSQNWVWLLFAAAVTPVAAAVIGNFATSAQGWELGKQTAAASLGVTLGSAAGGLLHNVAAL